MTRKLTNDEFINKLVKIGSNIEPLEPYKTSATKILVRCRACGHTWRKTPNSILSGQGCPVCSKAAAIKKMSESKRKSHEQFVNEAASRNDKVRVVGRYRGSAHKVEVECVKCGRRWLAYPGNILSGAGCQSCSVARRRLSIQGVIARIKEVNPDIELVGNYTMASGKATFRCNVCGYTWDAIVSSVAGGTGCPECMKKRFSAMKTKSHEQYVAEVEAKSPNIEIIGHYTGSANGIAARCKKCGYVWSTSASHLLGDTGCPQCAGNIQLTHDEFVKRMARISPSIEILGCYQSSKDKVDVKCRKCGHEWSPSATSLLRGSGCIVCAGTYKKSNAEFLEELSKVNNSIRPLEEYRGANNKIEFECLTCGNRWSARPQNILHGQSCPECAIGRRSFFEHVMLFAARGALGEDEVLSRDRKTIDMELDIYIPSMNLAFEPGSWYYHKERIRTDQDKRAMCADAGIKLVTVYFAFTGNDKAPDGCFVTENLLGANDWDNARETARKLLEENGVDCWKVDWDDVRNKALAFSGRRTTEMFRKELAEIRPEIEVLGEYAGSSCRIPVKCGVCGHEWNPLAGSLLYGHGCRKCYTMSVGLRSRKTHEQFVEELAKLNLPVKLIGKYDGCESSIAVKCTNCGHEWNSTPTRLLHGKACPKCSNRTKLSQDEFVEKVATRNPNVTVLGAYTGSNNKVQVKCNDCGSVFYTLPGTLYRGGGCAKCGRSRNIEARRKTHDKFVSQLSEINGDIEVVGTYRYAREKIALKCKLCGNEWEATPDNVLRGRKCPRCHGKAQAPDVA